MSSTLKILVAGDVEGRFVQLFNRVNSIQKKVGPFDMLFCVGNFFGSNNSDWAKYKDGTTKVPVDTFVLGPNQPEHAEFFDDINGCELCERVTYLGKKGIYTGSSGLSIAYLSGIQGADSDASHFTVQDVNALRVPLINDSNFKGVDLLLTSQWPKGAERYGIDPEGGVISEESGSSLISQLCLSLRPRYHFSGLEGVFYERQPYRNHKVLQEAAQNVTRFIAMARVGNPEKKKFIYACNMVPLKHMSEADFIAQPQDVTECPYEVDSAISQGDAEPERAAQFFYDQNVLDGKSGNHRGGKRKSDGRGGPGEKRKPAQPSGPCWFCLGSPEVEKHLVVSVGTHTYVALAKGGLVNDHVLILPIGHHQSTVSAPEEVIEEIEKYKKALKKCFKKQGKSVVFFERNFKTSHLQIQVIPVPSDVARDVKPVFEETAVTHSIELDEIPKMTDLKQVMEEGVPYFYAELPLGEKLLKRVTKGFPLQFGRDVLAHDSLLNLPHRVDWRNCKSTKEQETEMTKEFRQQFQPFDFNDE